MVAPRATRIQPVDAGGVRAAWVSTASVSARHVVLYLHGGGYVLGGVRSHRNVAARLADACGARVLLIDYALAPAYPCPHGVRQVLDAWRWLLGEGAVDGTRLTVAGDSAGGGLALALATQCREERLALPAALALFSPWVDLRLDVAGVREPAEGERLLSREWLRMCARLYLAGREAQSPLASPLLADLAGLPPVLIQYAAGELLAGDSQALGKSLDAAQVEVRLQGFDGVWHAWQLFAGLFAPADRALRAAADFLCGSPPDATRG